MPIFSNENYDIQSITDETTTIAHENETFERQTPEFAAWCIEGPPNLTDHISKNVGMSVNIQGLNPEDRAVVAAFVNGRTYRGIAGGDVNIVGYTDDEVRFESGPEGWSVPTPEFVGYCNGEVGDVDIHVIRNMALRAYVAQINPDNRAQLTTALNTPTYKG